MRYTKCAHTHTHIYALHNIQRHVPVQQYKQHSPPSPLPRRGGTGTFSLFLSSLKAAIGEALTAPKLSKKAPSGPFQWPAHKV